MDSWWTVIQVDAAIHAVGSKIEALLSQYDDKGKPRHSLDQLLSQSKAKAKGKVTQIKRGDGRVGEKPKKVE